MEMEMEKGDAEGYVRQFGSQFRLQGNAVKLQMDDATNGSKRGVNMSLGYVINADSLSLRMDARERDKRGREHLKERERERDREESVTWSLR